MMAASTFVSEDLHCPQCSDIYCLPVLLACGHNVCNHCLKKFWEWKGCRPCPVCGVESASVKPPINLQLKIAADQYQAQNVYIKQGVCLLHNETLKVFCNNDEELICVICQISKQHKVHQCCPVEEAAQQKKTEISAILDSLRKTLRTLNQKKQQMEETKAYIQTQSVQIEEAIKEEFRILHQFLWEEETNKLKALKQEEETKVQVMLKKIKDAEKQIQTLSSNIRETETALRARDLSFLQGYKQTKKRVKCNIQEPEYIRDILINSAKHLGILKFRIWKKMANSVKYAPIILDPNTAQPNLKLCQDLTSLHYSQKQPLPDNPERCTNRVCVLGATGFTSGFHSWTVELGQAKDWHVGVVRESIKRKSTIFLNPDEGFWVIGLCNGESLWAESSPRALLTMKQKPERITVKLDLNKGKVVFINTANSTVIHTFKDKFTERIFPYFSLGLNEDWKNSSPLTICPLTISVNTG
ncbi:zinc-binding protein A33 [Oryzias melastigma]|uniref:zinc-binding protein A33 n=1 Tax=Oryzias melastigma TaxID=30732 RepID=UPI000CF80A6D|nr:zinc-binding protein A33 [Oryzias melastigma]